MIFCRDKAEEEAPDNNEEDLIAKAEQDFFASINTELQDREKKNVERNRAFEEAKDSLANDQLPHEQVNSRDEKPSPDTGHNAEEQQRVSETKDK